MRRPRIGDRLVHIRSLDAGEDAVDEVLRIDDEQIHFTRGSVDLDELADEWMHFDGTAISQ